MATAAPSRTMAAPVASQESQAGDVSGANPKPQRSREKARVETGHER